ncbi:MAG: division/cell wall cluster transcriptional repressor MraZ [Clostridia bacterium]|nr:division/cell wall cluster transcriptional repressor MraZ [Clostridia bacterium]
MLYGSYDHTLDKKGRVSIPSKLRDTLGNDFMICPSFNGTCLCVYSNEEWGKLVEKIGQLPLSKSSKVKRKIFGNAFNVELDSQGRILIPAVLREYAQLDTDVHIAGVDTNLEIWDAELWRQENEDNSLESIASLLEELNF